MGSTLPVKVALLFVLFVFCAPFSFIEKRCTLFYGYMTDKTYIWRKKENG